MGGGGGNCANAAFGDSVMVASVMVIDSIRSILRDMVFSLSLELRFENRHRLGSGDALRRGRVVLRRGGLVSR